MAERRFFRRKAARPAEGPTKAAPRAATPAPKRSRYRIGDAVLTGLGLGLGVASFTFPWYVFYNQDKFGPTAIRFESSGNKTVDLSGPFYTQRVQWAPQRLTEAEIQALELDVLPTGTVRSPDEPRQPHTQPAAQPFPSAPPFDLVHVANGRAMIRDANGFWVVEKGSVLPDNSLVVSIEQRGGNWVLRTSANASIELAP